MLTLWRRHTTACKHRAQGRDYTKCACPIWLEGRLEGRRIRESLETRDWARAVRLKAKREEELLGGRVRKPISEAVASFFEQISVETSTLKRYNRALEPLEAFLTGRGLRYIDQVTVEDLDAFRLHRDIAATTQRTEIQTLRQFFGFCLDRDWAKRNPAKKLRAPREGAANPREPYTSEEIIRILAACDTFGRSSYERLRARAMILLQRYYGLRVSDVATMRRERIGENAIFIRAMKNGAAVWLPMVEEVRRAIECLPIPQGAGPNCPYLFWTGNGSRDGHIKTVVRTLRAVFDESGVENAVSHRFRHTLATEILSSGGSLEDAANVLGDEPATIRKHYAKWSLAYRDRTINVMLAAWGTKRAHEENVLGSPIFTTDRMVLEVGVEQNTPTENTQVTDSSSPQKPQNRQKRKSWAQFGHTKGGSHHA